MILLLNTLITEERLGWANSVYDRTGLKTYGRLEVFKYALAGLAEINWSRIIINAELGADLAEHQEELADYIRSIFSLNKLTFSPKRNVYQTEWKEQIEREIFSQTDNCIFFLCNDDHIYLGDKQQELWQIDRLLNDVPPTQTASCYPSHWPELLNLAYKGQGIEEKGFVHFGLHNNCDSVQFVTQSVLRSWWFDHEYGQTMLPRSDYFDASVQPCSVMTCYVPKTELFRHFDGYGHCGVRDFCRAIEIPPEWQPGGAYVGPRVEIDKIMTANAKARLEGLTIPYEVY